MTTRSGSGYNWIWKISMAVLSIDDVDRTKLTRIPSIHLD